VAGLDELAPARPGYPDAQSPGLELGQAAFDDGHACAAPMQGDGRHAAGDAPSDHAHVARAHSFPGRRRHSMQHGHLCSRGSPIPWSWGSRDLTKSEQFQKSVNPTPVLQAVTVLPEHFVRFTLTVSSWRPHYCDWEKGIQRRAHFLCDDWMLSGGLRDGRA